MCDINGSFNMDMFIYETSIIYMYARYDNKELKIADFYFKNDDHHSPLDCVFTIHGEYELKQFSKEYELRPITGALLEIDAKNRKTRKTAELKIAKENQVSMSVVNDLKKRVLKYLKPDTIVYINNIEFFIYLVDVQISSDRNKDFNVVITARQKNNNYSVIF